MIISIRQSLVVILMTFTLLACSEQQQDVQAPGLAPPAGKAEPVAEPQAYKFELSEPNYLRQRIPSEALAYIRLPQLFSFLSAPKGDIFTRAFDQEQHRKLVARLQDKLSQTIANDFSKEFKPLLALWLQHARAPIEFVVLSNEHQQPLPRVLMATTLEFDSQAAFAVYLKDLVEREHNLYMLNDQIAVDGEATLAAGPLSIELHYDADSRRLRLLAGMGIDRKMMHTHFADLQEQSSHPMYKPESAIDSSHYGLFVWLNIEKILPVAGNAMPPAQYQKIKDSLLAEARALSAGIGVSRGKGRMRVMADFNQDALSTTLPSGGMSLDLASSGKPRVLAAMSLTSAQQLKELEQNSLRELLGANSNDYESMKEQFAQASGFSIEEALTALGPEVLFLQDDLGEYSAIAVRDQALYQQLLERWIEHAQLKYKKTKINGVTIHHLQTKPWFIPKNMQQEAVRNPFTQLLYKLRSHAYWIEEDGYLIYASVPQLLLDRSQYKTKTRIADWLKQTQKQEAESALLLGSGRVQGSPAKLYYAHLQTLLLLGDIAGIDLDIAHLPSATDVSLPQDGTYGIQLSVSDRQVFAELVYENNPAEFLMGQGMTNVAVVGILAAIAVPAYQDYTLRARVDEALAAATSVRLWVSEYWQEHAKFPAKVDIDGYDIAALGLAESIAAIRVVPDTGQVIVDLAGHARLQGKNILLKPEVLNGDLQWSCKGGNLPSKYRPRSCR